MRPVRLEIQGFTCYRQKQAIDFGRLGLFAISGPTGAGKSSILDAMAYALYGKVPRMGGQNLDEFISLGEPQASLLFDFDIQHERFRVARSMRRSGATKAQLEQISNGSQKTLCDGVTDVNKKLESLLGLKYDAFIQSVLLPQGQFAKFLQSKPADQRQILRELLRVGIYERMRERASSQARDLDREIARDGDLLERHYAGATPQDLARVRDELEHLNASRMRAAAELDCARRCLEKLQAQWTLVQERRRREEQLLSLQERRSGVEDLRNRLERARLAAQVFPALERSAAKLELWREDDEERNARLQTLESAKKAVQTAEQACIEAQKQADKLPAKRNRALDLTQIQPALKERNSSALRRDRFRRDLENTDRAIADAKGKIQIAEKDVAASTEEIDRLEKQRSDIGYDAAALTILKRCERPAYDLRDARSQAAVHDPERFQTALRDAEACLQAAQVAFERAQAACELAVEQAKTAQSNYEAARDKHKAASLRSTLTPGCTCPVCLQTVHTVPEMESSPDLEAARILSSKLLAETEAARQRKDEACDKLSRGEANLDALRRNAAEWDSETARLNRRVEHFTATLITALRPFECPNTMLPEDFVDLKLRELEDIHSRWQKIGEALNSAILKVHKAQSALDGANRDLNAAEDAYRRLSHEVAEQEAAMADYDAQIRAIASDDPANELKSIQQEIERIETRQKRAIEHHREAERAAHDAETKTAEASARALSAARERDDSQATAEKALQQAGFADAGEVHTARMDERAIAAGKAKVEQSDNEVSQTKNRIAELENQLKNVSLSEADVSRAAEKAKTAEADLNQLDRSVGQATQNLDNLTRLTQEAEELRVKHAECIAQHELMHQLAQDLKSDAFQRYVLDGSFRRLVAGASTRLKELNDRYELTFTDGKFSVLDHDNGGLTRLADTLSGGETFLVSLALALELSEQVQQAAGAVRLDSLFIDEGFGTLDPETLETVASAIESLSKTNRMIGVITHVPELHRRLPRLEVRPTPTGSTVQFVED